MSHKHVMNDDPEISDLMDEVLDVLDGHKLSHVLGVLATTIGKILLDESGNSFISLQVRADGDEIVATKMSREGPIQ